MDNFACDVDSVVAGVHGRHANFPDPRRGGIGQGRMRCSWTPYSTSVVVNDVAGVRGRHTYFPDPGLDGIGERRIRCSWTPYQTSLVM
jgi:hypothetical protein